MRLTSSQLLIASRAFTAARLKEKYQVSFLFLAIKIEISIFFFFFLRMCIFKYEQKRSLKLKNFKIK